MGLGEVDIWKETYSGWERGGLYAPPQQASHLDWLLAAWSSLGRLSRLATPLT